MPIYSSLETIKEAMTSAGDYVHYKIYDQDENLMTVFKALATVTVAETFNNLEIFIKQMTGEGYIIIRLYKRDRKFTGGGNTAEDLKFYYRLSDRVKTTNLSGGGDGISLDRFLAVLTENNRLANELAIERLTAKFEKKEVKDTSYFETLANHFGKSFAKAVIKENGIGGDDDDEEEETKPKKKAKPVNDNPTTEEEKATVKDAFKRTGEATVKIMRVAKKFGGEYDDVAEGIENIARVAEQDPLRLKKLLEDLKK